MYLLSIWVVHTPFPGVAETNVQARQVIFNYHSFVTNVVPLLVTVTV
jgi:hypothetical protein